MLDFSRTCSQGQRDRLDVLLVAVVLVFAFLASSFLESSGDFWFHLAAGRCLAEDGFSLRNLFVPPGAFDLALFTLFRGTGGVALIVVKALGFAALAWLMLPPPRLRSTDATPLVVCTLLALLTLSPYTSLRPAILSYFFLALTLRLLLAAPAWSSGQEWKHLLLLGPLFVLWVNLDRWFWLGPMLVLLFWLGERLEALLGSEDKTGTVQRLPAWLPLAGVGACLLNPLGIKAFSFPSTWLDQPGWSASPWQADRLLSSVQRMDLASLAYPLLLGVGLVSLLLPGVRERGRRALVWASLAILSCWRSEMAPFFALVAGPLTTLNFQDALRHFADRRLPMDDRRAVSESPIDDLKLSFVNRWVLLAASLVLIFLAAVGGLQGMPRRGAVAGWGVSADDSFRQFVHTIRQWRQQARLRPDHRILALPQELAAYFAWFAPEEPLAQELHHELPALEAACRAGKGNLVAVDDPDRLRKLAGDPGHWLLLHVEGRITLWGWKDACSNPLVMQPFSANRLVFAADEEAKNPLPPRPDYVPAGDFLNRLASRQGSRGPDSEAASTYLHYFQAGVLPPYQRSWRQAWSAYAGSLLAAPPPLAFSLLLRLEQSPLFLGDIEKDLPAFPLLAIRAARRALAVDPDDANAYLRLGQAYRLLWDTAGERDRCRSMSVLAELRQAQAASALEQAARLDPESQTAHRLLAELYHQQGYLDAALHHRREELRLARRTGRRQGEDQPAFAKRLQRLEQRTRTLEGVVQERQKRFAALPTSVSQPHQRALAAFQLGLARQALDDILLPSSPILLESSGVNLELELLLRLGRIEQLREWMQGPELQKHGENLGLHNLPAPALPGYPRSYRLPAAVWFRFLSTAAEGDFELAQDQLHLLLNHLEAARQQRLRSLRRSLALALGDEILLSAHPELLLLQPIGHKDRLAATHLLNPLLTFDSVRADLSTLAGTFALEGGRLRQAEQDFEMAVGKSQSDAGKRCDFAARPLAEFYLQRLRAAQGRDYRLP